MNSFASKLLNAQRQAGRILVRQLPELDPTSIQQSFLLRGGNFVGVRWQAGEWSVEWLVNAAELVLLHADAESARIALLQEREDTGPTMSEAAASEAAAGPLIMPGTELDTGARRAA